MCYVEKSNGNNLVWKIVWRICSDMMVGMTTNLGNGAKATDVKVTSYD
jgi:hypothetical protein